MKKKTRNSNHAKGRTRKKKPAVVVAWRNRGGNSKKPKGTTRRVSRSKKTKRTKRNVRDTVTIVLRSTMVRPEETKREKIVQKKIRDNRHNKPQWYGTETKKNRATIVTRYRYVTVSRKFLSDESISEIIKGHVKESHKRFNDSSFNSISVTAQFIKGRVVDRHRARMAATAQVGTMIYGESIAKKVRKDTLQDGKIVPVIMETPKEYMKVKELNQETQIIDMIGKMQEYGLVTVGEARDKQEAQKLQRSAARQNKNYALTNRQEKGMIDTL